MSAHALRAERRPIAAVTLLRARVALRRARLDAALRAGTDCEVTRELSLRAAQLTRPRYRADLAASLEAAVTAAGRRRAGAAIPVCRSAVQQARDELLSLARELTQAQRPSPRGVALTSRLLTDGDGPLYHPVLDDELLIAARRARAAL